MIRIALATFLISTTASPALAQKTAKVPAAGTTFLFAPTAPKWVTCDVEFRDPANGKWPNFFYGKPKADARLVFAPEGSKIDLVFNCDVMAQRNGEQERRIFGELCKDRPPTVTLAITSLGKWTTETVEVKNDQGKVSKKTVDFAPMSGTLEVGGRSVKVAGKSTMNFRFEKGTDVAESVSIDTRFTIRGSDLGLTTVPGDIAVRAGATGYVTLPSGKKK